MSGARLLGGRTHRFASACLARGTLLAALVLSASLASAGTALAAAPPVVTTTGLPSGEVGVAYSTRLTASGGTAPLSWSVISGSLPSGLSLGGGGTLSGTPRSAANASLVIAVTDSTNSTATAALVLNIAPGPQVTTVLPPAQVGAAYSVNLQVSGGTAPFTFSVASGGLPGGLLLSSSGVLAGRPGAIATSTIQVKVTDSLGSVGTKGLSLAVLAPPAPQEQLGVVSDNGTLSVMFSNGAPTASLQDPPDRVTGLAVAPGGSGYWAVTSRGGVLAYGVANLGQVGRRSLRGRAVGIAALPSGGGYWIASSTGRVYAFGAAHRYGSLHRKDVRIVGIAADWNGRGYWLVSASGKVYAFGGARHLGSVRGARPGSIVGIAAVPTSMGYWVVSSSGRVHIFGAAKRYRQTGSPTVAQPIAGIAAAPTGTGYWLVARSGLVMAHGSATAFAQPLGPAGAAAVAGSN